MMNTTLIKIAQRNNWSLESYNEDARGCEDYYFYKPGGRRLHVYDWHYDCFMVTFIDFEPNSLGLPYFAATNISNTWKIGTKDNEMRFSLKLLELLISEN